jgi:hypothetical protein
MTMAIPAPILTTKVRGFDRFLIKGRGEAIIVAVDAPYMDFAGSLFRRNRQLILRSGEKTFRVERYELVHVDNPGEARGAFGMMATDAPDWLQAGNEVQVLDGGPAAPAIEH